MPSHKKRWTLLGFIFFILKFLFIINILLLIAVTFFPKVFPPDVRFTILRNLPISCERTGVQLIKPETAFSCPLILQVPRKLSTNREELWEESLKKFQHLKTPEKFQELLQGIAEDLKSTPPKEEEK